jgi:polyisoprenoid-binding protein YceI
MKKSIFPALLLAWTITRAVAVPESYEINAENSSVLFKARLLWTTNVEGCFCGSVSGRVSFDDPLSVVGHAQEIEPATTRIGHGVL